MRATFRALLVVCALAACDEDVPATAESEEVVPMLDGEPWTVARNPHLGALSGPQQQPVDFAVWQAADGTTQLVSCIRGTKEGGETRLLHRWEGARVTDGDWAARGVFMRADPNVGETVGGLQAPHVVRDNGSYRMLYGDWKHIASATSEDGKTFERLLDTNGKGRLFDEGEGANTRDPMVLTHRDVHNVFYTAHPGGVGGVYLRTTADFRTFSASKLVARGGEAGSGMFSAECPQVVFHEATKSYFLFRTQTYGERAETRIYRSKTLDDFGVDDDRKLVARLPFAAPEYLRTQDGEFLFFLRSDLQGIMAARLRWVRGR